MFIYFSSFTSVSRFFLAFSFTGNGFSFPTDTALALLVETLFDMPNFPADLTFFVRTLVTTLEPVLVFVEDLVATDLPEINFPVFLSAFFTTSVFDLLFDTFVDLFFLSTLCAFSII